MAIKKQVEVIDWNNEPYEPDDIKKQILSKYGASSDFNHCYLKRKNKAGQYATLRDYLAELPEEESIKNEFGGGDYMLWVTFDDPNTTSGRNMVKIPILIEGTSIIPDYSGENLPGKPVESDDKLEDKMLDRLAKYKVIFGGGDGKDSKMDFVIEQMKNQNNIIVEMIKTKNTSGNDKLTELLLGKALDRNTSDLDIFLKAKKIFDTGAPSADEYGWLKSMAPALVPLLGKLLGGNKPGAPAGVNGSPQQAALPAGENSDIVNAINQMGSIINSFGERLDKIDSKIKDIEEGIEPYDPDEETPGDPAEEKNIINLNSEQGSDEMDFLKPIADQIRAATPEAQNEALKEWVLKSGARATYDFCIMYQLVKDLAEFNSRMETVGLPALTI